MAIEKWEAIDITNEVSIDVEMFEFACCGFFCGGGGPGRPKKLGR